jgi:hypothetical protein
MWGCAPRVCAKKYDLRVLFKMRLRSRRRGAGPLFACNCLYVICLRNLASIAFWGFLMVVYDCTARAPGRAAVLTLWCRRLWFLLIWLSGGDDGIRCVRKGSLDPSVSQRSGSGFRPIRGRTLN